MDHGKKVMKPKRLHLVNLINKVLPISSCNKLKTILYKWAGVNIGKNCELCGGAKIMGNGEIYIGNHVFIGVEALIYVNKGSKVILEDYTIVGIRSILITGFHPITPEGPRIIGYAGSSSTVKICQGASIGTRVIVLPGITVNTMAHCAAGGIVTKDVPPYTRVGGIPAKFMKDFREGISNH